jgi:hypothetical protein
MSTVSHHRKASKQKRILTYASKRRLIPTIAFALLVGVIASRLLFKSLAYPGQYGGGSDGQSGQSPPPATPNPSITENTCGGGIDIAMVADLSGSVTQSSEFPDLTTALSDFVSSLLPSSDTKLSLTEFGDSATLVTPLTNNIQALNNGIAQLSNQGSTNWVSGFTEGYNSLSAVPSKTPRLLVFATDGYPNEPGGATTALNDAVVEANTIKAAGIHVLVIGLGSGVNLPNLEAVSGTNVNDGSTATINTDVITGGTYAALDGDLLRIAAGTCGNGNGTGGNGNGSGGTGNGNGTGGTGTGSNGSGSGTTGTGTGNSSGPQVQPLPNPAPKPTQNPSPNPAPAPAAAIPSNQPTPAPKPSAQGTQIKPPIPPGSPFFDGQQYSPGSAPDTLASAVTKQAISVWWYVAGGVLVVLIGGLFVAWRLRRAKKVAVVATLTTKKSSKTS